ncbi:hypothetical protein [Enterococcus sp. AZ012]|uniref:hypothetical protein n=1 Tax=Enterococcus sp. AZ012 TaxID=2774682 RepID=UPI003D283E50
MTIMNSDRIWLGIGIEVLLVASIWLILYFIFTSGAIRKDVFSKRGKSKITLWLAVLLMMVTMVLIYKGMISGSTYSF